MKLALALVLAGCTDDVQVLPVLDLPVGDPDAEPFSALDEIIVSVAHAGDDTDVVNERFSRGQPLAFSGIPFGDDLVIHLTGYDRGSAYAYGRTCEISVDPAAPTARPHLFFSRSLRFARTGLESVARAGGRAVSLDGAAILIGGTVHDDPVLAIERFDPRTGELSMIGTATERVGAVDALLGTTPPRVVILGGRVSSVGAGFIEVIDPQRPIEVIDDGHIARVGLTATSLTDGRVIAIGGAAPNQPPSGTITQVATDGANVEITDLRAALAHPRTGHTATRLGDDLNAPVLIAGGVSGTGAPVPVAELFRPLSDDLARPTTFAPQMIVPRSGHAAVRMPDGSVLFIGGLDSAGNHVRTLERFSFDAGFVVVGELPANAAVLDSTVTTLPDGRVLIVGGRDAPGGAATDTAFIAILRDDGSIEVVPTIDRTLAVPRAGHQAALLCDGTVLITGGTDGAALIERYNPPAAERR
jgi:hypothetical protein